MNDHDPRKSSAEPGERVAKALARAGVASRREVERLIEAGRVALNGQVLTTPAVKVSPGDILTVDGAVVSEPEAARVWRYHKPVGLMTTHRDPKGRPTVFEALPKELPRVISVGRLDLNSEGLLLLTNDGALARALELPANGWKRRYRARARGRVTQARLDKLKEGITIEGVHYGAIEARLDQWKDGPPGANIWVTVTIAEGKNREVRKVLEALGLTVNRLIRLGYGPFELGELASGAVEEVNPRDIREHLTDFIAPANLPKGDRVQTPKSSPLGEGDRAKRGGGGLRPQRRGEKDPPQSASRTAPPRGEHSEVKKAYKPGWAKPKPKTPIGPAKPRRHSGKSAGPAPKSAKPRPKR